MNIPDILYHATPLYRYDPDATDNHGVWCVKKHGFIKGRGLMPSDASSKDIPAIYLASQSGVSENYAENNFGEEWAVDWVVLAVDARGLQVDAFLPDIDQELDTALDDLLALGHTHEKIIARELPWEDVLSITGQVRYRLPIPDNLLSVHSIVRIT